MALFVSSGSADLKRMRHRIRKAANLCLIAVFIVSLGLMFSGIFRKDTRSEIERWERRRPEEFPKLRYKTSGLMSRPETRSIKLFPRQFEKWFNDRIRFRRSLIQLYQTMRFHDWVPRQLAITSTQYRVGAGQMPVLVGKNGWLYLNEPASINEARGLNLLTRRELELWKQTLEQRRDWFAKRGIRYVLLIAPNKATIYPENLPDSMEKASQLSRLEQLTDYLAAESDVTVINLVEPLRQAKSKAPLYFKTDTHWNQYGAFIAYQELMKPLCSWFPQLRGRSLDDYDVIIQDRDISPSADTRRIGDGDLAVMLGTATTFHDQFVEFAPRRKALEVSEDYQGFHRHEAEDEKHQLTRVVVQHDSFMSALSRFITPHCREVTYIHLETGTLLPIKEIQEIQPVLVIDEIVQRHFAILPPDNPPEIAEEMRAER